jgi:Zn-dependent protease
VDWVIELFGIPVRISFGIILIGLWLWLDVISYIREQTQITQIRTIRECLFAGMATVLVLVSICLHEVAHAVVAHMGGVKIVEAGFAGFFAYVLPEIPLSQISPWKEIVIALAGPAMNFLIAAIFVVPVKIWGESLAENTFQYIAYINIRLGRLNLLPVIVLDGGWALHGFLRLLSIGDPHLSSLMFVATAGSVLYLILFRKKKSLGDRLESL